MTIRKAFIEINKKFPFDGYLKILKDSCLNIVFTVCKYVVPGGRILDFGSGPCDKTAIIQMLGRVCSACDDLGDGWHKIPENREKLMRFVKESGIDFRILKKDEFPFKKKKYFDLVMLNDVIEHLHNSPRELLNSLIEYIKPGGYLMITVPNIVNLRKRLDILAGKSNLPVFEQFYWYPGEWRGHIREYSKRDLKLLAEYLGLNIEELHGCHHSLRMLPKIFQPLYRFITWMFPNFRDSLVLVARKPENWQRWNQLDDTQRKRMIKEDGECVFWKWRPC